MKSIREESEPLLLIQLEDVGWRYPQISIEEEALRRRFRAQDYSRDTSKGSDPPRARDRSKTVLKSPASTVGINPDRNIVKELITLWVTIRSINTADTKNLVTKTKSTHQKYSVWIRPRLYKRQSWPK